MKNAPAIGDRVTRSARPNCGAFNGVVIAIYPTYFYDEALDRETHQLPERQWHVGVQVDVVPELWPYPGRDRIAPMVADLRLLRGKAGQGACA